MASPSTFADNYMYESEVKKTLKGVKGIEYSVEDTGRSTSNGNPWYVYTVTKSGVDGSKEVLMKREALKISGKTGDYYIIKRTQYIEDPQAELTPEQEADRVKQLQSMLKL